jgi:hypothetical protein
MAGAATREQESVTLEPPRLRIARGLPQRSRDSVEQSWRIMAPLVGSPPAVYPYAPDSWGPKEADGILTGLGPWHDPWVAS